MAKHKTPDFPAILADAIAQTHAPKVTRGVPAKYTSHSCAAAGGTVTEKFLTAVYLFDMHIEAKL